MMKTNFVEKTATKWKLFTIILSAIIVVGIVLAAIFGFNTTADMKSAKIVSVDYNNVYVESSSEITDVCEKSFKDSGVKPIKKTLAPDSTDCEVIYYFKADADLTAAVSALKTELDSNFINVNVHEEEFVKGIAEGFILRAAIAVAVFAVLAFVYVSLRYKLSMGITMATAIVAAGALTVAIVGGTRIPVTPSFAYAAIFAVLVTVVLVLLTFNRLRENAKDKDKQKEMSPVEKVVEAVDVKQSAILVAAFTVVVALLGALVATARWFALTAFVGILVAVFVAVFFAPALVAILDEKMKVSDKPLFKSKKKKAKELAKKESSDAEAEVSVQEEVTEEAQAE